MLRIVLTYERNRQKVPVIETRDAATAKLVAEVALREYQEGLVNCDDAVLREVIAAESEQARRVLRAAGLEVGDA